MITEQDYINELRKPSCERIFKIEFLDKNLNVISSDTLNVLDGSLSIALQSNARRNCSLMFENSSGIYIPNEDSNFWLDKQFRVYSGLKINGEESYKLRGTFLVGNPVITSNFAEKTANVEGLDKWAMLDGSLGGTLEDTVTFPVGTTIEQVVTDIFTDIGEIMTPLVYPTDMVTQYTINKSPGDTIGSILIELAEFLSWEVFYDVEGIPRFQPPKDFAKEGSSWDFGINETTYKGGIHSYGFNDIRNVVKVIGDNIKGSQVEGVAEDTNIFSPFNIYKLPRKAKIINDALIHTVLYAEQRAEYELQKLIALQESISVKAVQVDTFEEGDIITIDDPSCDLNRDRCQVQSINYPLRNDGEMTLSVWKERKYY